MRIRLLHLIAATATATAAAPLDAQADPGELRWQFDGFGGGHFFNNDDELGVPDIPNPPTPDHSVAFGIRLGYWFTPMLGVEAEGAAMPTEASVGDATSEQFIVGYRLSAVVQFGAGGRVMPFLLAGAGGESNSSERDDILADDTEFVPHAGAGVKFALGEAWGIRADARLLMPPSSASEGLTADFEGLVGLYKLFGGRAAPADADGDGILGASDRCPNEAEDRDDVQDDDGCPDPDNDGDGIADAADRCPAEPETMNQVEDTDGCPEKDEDGDGVFGAADQCPSEAEDKDGFQDDNGCPDVDNDGDGIADVTDKCPAEPETVNQFEDTDGCADQVPAAVAKFTGVIQGITFQVNSAALTPESSTTLGEAVNTLQQYPAIRLEISGHSDNIGEADHNRRLSQRRADKVKEYLVSKGIAAERLEAKGYGPDKPIADNATSAGRNQNRRVEFTLLGAGGTPATPPAATPATPPAAPSTPEATKPDAKAQPQPAPQPKP